jgi:hypothetical protein
MTEITRALWAFWGQFEANGHPLTAYQTGAVPDGAALPYVTFSPAQTAAFDTLPLVATLWVRHDGENTAPATALAAAWMDAVSAAIPQEGVRLDLHNGFLILDRGSGDFLSMTSDPEDKNVLGARVGYEIRYYTT